MPACVTTAIRSRSRSWFRCSWIIGIGIVATLATWSRPAPHPIVCSSSPASPPESGDTSVVLDSLRAPVEIAVAEINAAGGVNGQPVKLVTGDEGSDPTTARATFQRLVTTEHADAIIGPVTSRAAVALQSQIGAARVLTCSGADHSAPIVESSSKGFYVRTVPPDRLEGQALAELVLADGRTRVAIPGPSRRLRLRGRRARSGARWNRAAPRSWPARPTTRPTDVSAALRTAAPRRRTRSS